ncbi:MAG: phosphomannomutase/phosphoglucomutase [Acutalibacteraceae bacterium]
MLNDFWKQFKSGTDIRGVATAGAGYEVNLTDETVTAMVNGFILWLAKKTGKNPDELKISVGRDSRISGPHISSLSMNTMKKAGVQVISCGLASTPSMFMTTVELECNGALQITASHHPYYRNGLKFFTREGGLEGEDIVSILEYAQNGEKPLESTDGEIIEADFMSQYAANLREMIKAGVNSSDDYDHPLKGFKIVVDAGNGAGGFYATDVLEALGANINGSQFLEPDGMFPNHIPNPENAEAMKSICNAVKKSNADLGVIFDTDVDRGGAVDASGNEINRNRLVALASAIALEGNDGGLIVTDSITSSGLKDFIENELGGKHLRFKRGYKNVIDEALRQNADGVNCPLAIETSGHAAMRENYFLDDGAYLVTKIIIKMVQLKKAGKTLESLTEKLSEPVESREVRIKITEKNFREYGEKVIADMFGFAKKNKDFVVADDNHEGIRVSFGKDNGDGWFLLRLSVHDPIMPLNIESDSTGGVDKIYKKILPFLEDCKGLDTYKEKPTAPKKSTTAKSATTAKTTTAKSATTKKATTTKTTTAKKSTTKKSTKK